MAIIPNLRRLRHEVHMSQVGLSYIARTYFKNKSETKAKVLT
jgi:hypothetical protein